jgi:hypothetical protein
VAVEDGSGSSYSAMYKKTRERDPNEPPWYKIHTMKDYKKMQKEMEIQRGTLGPDLDTSSYKEKVRRGIVGSHTPGALWVVCTPGHCGLYAHRGIVGSMHTGALWVVCTPGHCG